MTDDEELAALRHAFQAMGLDPQRVAAFVASPGDDVCKHRLLGSIGFSEEKAIAVMGEDAPIDKWRTYWKQADLALSDGPERIVNFADKRPSWAGRGVESKQQKEKPWYHFLPQFGGWYVWVLWFLILFGGLHTGMSVAAIITEIFTEQDVVLLKNYGAMPEIFIRIGAVIGIILPMYTYVWLARAVESSKTDSK